MIIGHTHTCPAGHIFKRWVFFGPKPTCPTCVQITDDMIAKVAKQLQFPRNWRDRPIAKPPITQRYSYPPKRETAGHTSTTVDNSQSTDYVYAFKASSHPSAVEDLRPMVSGGGGDFGGGGATSSWEPATDTCSRSSESNYSSSSDSNSSSCDSSSSSSSD